MALPEHLKICNTRHGVMLVNVHDLYISRSLLIYGEFSEQEFELLAPFIKPDATVLDIGANIGTHTLAFARAASQGVVLAFEPQRGIFQMLNANVALNALTNVMTYQLGIGAAASRVLIPAFDYSTEGNFGAIGIQGHDSGEIISITTVDSMTLPRVDLMKIDVEGMEADVLEGARNTIAQHKPLLYIENDRVDKSPALIRMLQEMDYDMWWHVVPYFRTNSFTGQTENIFGNTIGINMFCAPKSAALTISVPNTEKVSDADDHPMKRAELKRSIQMS